MSLRVLSLFLFAGCASGRTQANPSVVPGADLAPAMHPGPHEVALNGARYYYRIGGSAPAGTPPVVFLHGGPGQDSVHFDALAGPFMERDLRMVYFDQRGSGASERPASGDYALSTLVEDLEGECRDARHRVAALAPPPAPEPRPELPAVAPAAEEHELPATLLAGRTVFFFTGELRKSSAETMAESLRALGADEIRTFCLRQGSGGPDAYPPDALVVVDFRFVGHSQSGLIQDRARRSGAQFLAVRSGKGSLARTVASAL